MCRNIKVLYNFDPPATEEEIMASSLQYVRKISGMHTPSAKNRAAFERAVDEVAAITRRLLHEELQTQAYPRDRLVERERAKARGQARDAQVLRRARAVEPTGA